VTAAIAGFVTVTLMT